MTETDHMPKVHHNDMSREEALKLLRAWSKEARENPSSNDQSLFDILRVAAAFLEAAAKR